MNDELLKVFYDILQATAEIEEFVSLLDYQSFLADIKTQKAVEREFEIIGEALNRIKKMDGKVLEHISEHRKIIGFRNVLAHGYDVIDEMLIWTAVVNHLPILKNEINNLLLGDNKNGI